HRARDRRQPLARGLGRARHRSRGRRDHHHGRPGDERVDQPGPPARPAVPADGRRRAHAQLDQGVRCLHPGQPDRRDARGLRLRLDRDAAEGVPPDQGSRHRARPGPSRGRSAGVSVVAATAMKKFINAPVDGGAGVLHIVKNYTGDVMNFKLAAELAEDEGVQVESVLTNDDVAVEDSLWTAGRRGVGVTVLLEKIAGAKAEAGGSLAEVAAVATKANERGRSFGVALTDRKSTRLNSSHRTNSYAVFCLNNKIHNTRHIPR